jgi:hypothetical protein
MCLDDHEIEIDEMRRKKKNLPSLENSNLNSLGNNVPVGGGITELNRVPNVAMTTHESPGRAGFGNDRSERGISRSRGISRPRSNGFGCFKKVNTQVKSINLAGAYHCCLRQKRC